MKLNKRQKKLWRTFGFLVRLLVLSIPLYIVIGLGISLMPLQVVVAGMAGRILEQMGFSVIQQGALLSVAAPGVAVPFGFIINEDCTGWKSMLFLFALIFAMPKVAMRKRLWGLAIGLPIIWVGNLARIIGVVLAERAYGVETALLIHDYGWQAGLIALVLGLWIIWLWWARQERKRKSIWATMKEIFR
jgi:exosortase/archaeosortase family protein